jgi:hypothetical protein
MIMRVRIRSGQPSWAMTWLWAVVVPLLAAIGSWFWAGATISTQVCASGSSAGAKYLIGLMVLAALGPAVTGWRGWRARLPLARVTLPAVVSLMLAVPLIFVVVSWWFSSHHCMT